MTHHVASSLLDDYLDGDLDPTVAGEISRHLESCPVCQAEYESSLRLKELLKQHNAAQPEQGYWEEITQRIHMRTVESDPIRLDSDNSDDANTVDVRRDFVRSLAALAASIAILFSALQFGQTRDQDNYLATVEGREILLTNYLHEDLSSELSQAQATEMTRAYLLLGSPGVSSRGLTISDYPRASNPQPR